MDNIRYLDNYRNKEGKPDLTKREVQDRLVIAAYWAIVIEDPEEQLGYAKQARADALGSVGMGDGDGS